MFTVENDWIQYEPVPARRVAVRGGAACAVRIRVERARPVPAVAPVSVAVPVRPQAVRGKRTRLRLTRRGRFVLAGLPVLLAASGLLTALTAPVTAEASPASASSATVESGETLWSLAERIAPTRDPRDVVAEIESANGLRGALVRAGQVLVLPADLAG